MSAPSRPAPSVAVVVVSFNARDLLGACLDSVERYVGVPLEVVVVDNASSDGSRETAETRGPAVRLISNPTNRGFARACNQGLRATEAPHVLFLNPDAEITAGSVETMAGRLDSAPDIGAVAPLTRHGDGTLQVSTGPDLTLAAESRQRRLVRGVRGRAPWALQAIAVRYAHEHEPDWVSGACLMARRQALEAVGGFDEDYFLYEEDADLCRRLRRAGWRILFTPAAEVRHRLGQSMARAPAESRLAYHRSHLLYYRKHNGVTSRLALRVLLAGRALIGCVARDSARRGESRQLLGVALGRA